MDRTQKVEYVTSVSNNLANAHQRKSASQLETELRRFWGKLQYLEVYSAKEATTVFFDHDAKYSTRAEAEVQRPIFAKQCIDKVLQLFEGFQYSSDQLQLISGSLLLRAWHIATVSSIIAVNKHCCFQMHTRSGLGLTSS